MKYVLCFLLVQILTVFAFSSQNPVITPEISALTVLEFKWSRARHTVEKIEPISLSPARPETPANRNYERNKANQTAGTRDPYLDSWEGRSAALEKNVQESRTIDGKSRDGFRYQIKVQNMHTKVADIVFWEYQFNDPVHPDLTTRRQFLCAVKIDPSKKREIQAFSLSGPSEVVSVEATANGAGNTPQEKVVINRVEYVDGSIWQRKDWKFSEIKLAYKTAVSTPWGKEMCRGL